MRKAVRGGTYLFVPDNAGCATRNGFGPGDHTDHLGFRVVLRWASVFDAPAAGPSDL